MSKKTKKILSNILYAVCVIALLLATWSVSAAAIGSEFILPDIKTTAVAFGEAVSGKTFWTALGGTMLRSAIGFTVSFALFFALFFLSTAFEPFAKIVEPIISALRSLPAVAVTLILSLVVGGYGTPIVLGVLVFMPIMYSAAKARVENVPRELAEISKLCGAGKLRTFGAVWFPYLAGALPESLSTAFSYNVKTVIGAEILAQTASSLGMMMKLSQAYYRTATLIALVVAAVIVSVLCETVIRVVLGAALKKYRD